MPASATAAVTEPVKKDSVPEIIAASMVGTAIEFYDNYCYSIAAARYFGAIFFANVTNPALAQIMAFTTFAVSFLARPFGSMLFGHFGDKMGRKKTLVIALLTMGVATFLVGCLPGYEQVGGVSVVILCVCRACQGVGASPANGPAPLWWPLRTLRLPSAPSTVPSRTSAPRLASSARTA